MEKRNYYALYKLLLQHQQIEICSGTNFKINSGRNF